MTVMDNSFKHEFQKKPRLPPSMPGLLQYYADPVLELQLHEVTLFEKLRLTGRGHGHGHGHG